MKIEIDLEVCSKNNITSIEYLYLWYLVNKVDTENIQNFINDTILENLLDKKYIILVDDIDDIIPTVLARNLFKGYDNVIDINKLSQQYRDLFPNIKIGNYPARSNIREIVEKFKRFFKSYQYSSEIILEATKLYITEKERVSWDFLATAKHFVIKKKINIGEEVSELATYCDYYINKGEEYKNQSSEKRL